MPSFVSINGVWHAAKEKVGLVNLSGKAKIINGVTVQPGDPYVYEGPDRAALYMLYENKVETLGQDFARDPQMVDLVRKMGFKDMKEYCDFMGIDPTEAAKAAKDVLALQVTKHELPKRVKEIEVMSGGTERGTGKEIRKGGFGDAPDL